MKNDTAEDENRITVDAFLGGRLSIAQPEKGAHRAGLDAIFLAAAVPAKPGDTVVDLGAGVGTAGLAVAARLQDSRIVLVEREPAMVVLARRNIEENRLTDCAIVIEADIAASGADRAAAGLVPDLADHVIVNPPYHQVGDVRRPPAAAKDRAYVLGADLGRWIRTAVSVLKPGGTLTVIHRPDALSELLGDLAGRCGEVTVLPLHPRAGRAATRVIVQARKGSRGPLALLDGFVLHVKGSNAYAAEADAVLRDAVALALDRN
ncbi:MAG: methyltransferase [Hyphomicrobiales bacterium]|nr:methyltransferase [Hyphomicrobiales bacterium]